ncbi:AAA family ATPase [Rhodococcus koreensis]|uniref:AAA family ATPase n=1 Tax=Rhodococcus koreensis TaxID=99653 RepID=UPI00366C6D12
MIRQITKIGNYRAFQNWHNQGDAAPFKRVNVVYGPNGSGKSTLACLFESGAQGTLSSVDLLLAYQRDGQPETTLNEDSEAFWRTVHVFNRDYVSRSMRFDHEDGPNPDSLLTLGEENVQTQAELESALAKRAEIEAVQTTRKTDIAAGKKQLDGELQRTAQLVVEELSAVSRYRATNIYHKGSVRNRLQQDRSVFSSASVDVEVDLQIVRAPRQQPVHMVIGPMVLGNEALAEVRALLDSEVTVDAIEALKGHEERAKWAQHGLTLHEQSDACYFCGQLLTERRRGQLEAHFDAALQRLQSRIDSTIGKLEQAAATADQRAESLPRPTEVYPELADELLAATDTYRTAAKTFNTTITELVNQLLSKRNNPFQTPELNTDIRVTPPSLDPINAILTTHNSRCTSHQADVDAAATRVELHRVASLQTTYDDLTSSVESAETEFTNAQNELRTLADRIVELEKVEANPVPLADELTTNVRRLLGRSELSFRTAGDGLRYHIERNGSPAKNLSEGECTAISLLHFLARLRSGDIAKTQPTVIIDDPVSSLDQDILFGVSAHIWAELVSRTTAQQVFLLTHNFELFRQWLVQLKSAGGHVQGGWTAHTLEGRHDGTRRVPTLTQWPTKNQESARLRSQYHYLFSRVAKSVTDAHTGGRALHERMDILALAPNSARRMLEAFLSFHYPKHIGDFHKGMRAAIQSVDDGPARVRIERYLHSYSHNEEGDIGKPLDVSEVATVVASLFHLIRKLDKNHYDAMCESLDIDGAALVAIAESE